MQYYIDRVMAVSICSRLDLPNAKKSASGNISTFISIHAMQLITRSTSLHVSTLAVQGKGASTVGPFLKLMVVAKMQWDGLNI